MTFGKFYQSYYVIHLEKKGEKKISRQITLRFSQIFGHLVYIKKAEARAVEGHSNLFNIGPSLPRGGPNRKVNSSAFTTDTFPMSIRHNKNVKKETKNKINRTTCIEGGVEAKLILYII